MKITAFAGSNSSKSINKMFVTYVSNLFESADVEILDINDYEMPLFSVDREAILGHPQLAHNFLDKLASADYILLSLAENNGNYSAAFKNLFDWCSRVRNDVFQAKPMLLMATSPGGRGGKRVLEIAEANLPRYGADIRATFSLPAFYENFDVENHKISNTEFDHQLRQIVKDFE